MLCRREIEVALWLVVLAGILYFVLARADLSRRAVAQLEADGYRDVVLIGHDCRVAKAIGADGEDTIAFACLTK